MQVLTEAYFKEIFFAHYDKIFSGFFKRTGSESIAQDLTQITFIKIWEYRSSFNFELPVELQVNRKAKLVFIDWLRKEAYQRKLMHELKQHTLPVEKHDKFELTDRLQSALSELPPVRKKVFTMAYIDGFSHKDIADTLHISVKTVDNHISKALSQLRKILAYQAVFAIISVFENFFAGK